MAEKLCPLFREACVEHRCRWYIQLLGTNPQTGEQKSEWGCAVEFIPILLIENAKTQRETGAAVESFRNESVRNTHALAAGMIALAQAPDVKSIKAKRQ